MIRPPLWPGPLLAGMRRLREDPVTPPAGDGRGVLLVNGFGAPGVAMRPLAEWLRLGGWRPRVAGTRLGVGCSEAQSAALEHEVDRAATRTGGSVALVAHSRGGQWARVAAVRRPELVSALVTLGTPFEPLGVSPLIVAQASLVAVAGSAGVPGLARIACLRGPCCAPFRRDLRGDPGVPFTSVFSRADGTVKWRLCRDDAARCVEVRCGHLGLLADRDAWRAIAAALAVPR